MIKREKFLISLVIITLFILVLGSINSLATTITPTISNTNTTNKNTNTNNSAVISASVTSNTNTNTKANTNTNKNVNTNNNVSNNTANKKLPYAGTDSTIFLVVIVLAVSAIYAYKKVSDYNV